MARCRGTERAGAKRLSACTARVVDRVLDRSGGRGNRDDLLHHDGPRSLRPEGFLQAIPRHRIPGLHRRLIGVPSMQRRRSLRLFLLSILPSIALVACAGSGSVPPQGEAQADVGEDGASPNVTGTAYRPLYFAYERPIVGAEVQVTADGLPPGKNVELTWSTVTG